MNKKDALLLQLKYNVWAKLKVNSYPSCNMSHSQFGEDMLVRFLTTDKSRGTYVDIGAHHPVLYSNTWHFYSKGWSGLNIDATPGSMEVFQVLRPRDINLEVCLSADGSGIVTFFLFDQPAYNTTSFAAANEVIASKKARLLEQKKLQTITINSCLDTHIHGRTIDFLSIDVEGLDETILMSLDWSKYKPNILIFEKANAPIEEIIQSEISTYLYKLGYIFAGKCGHSVIMSLPGETF